MSWVVDLTGVKQSIVRICVLVDKYKLGCFAGI